MKHELKNKANLINQLQDLLTFLGKYGGFIFTKAARKWPHLITETCPYENRLFLRIATGYLRKGHLYYDDAFTIAMEMDGGKIKDIELINYIGNKGRLRIDNDDNIWVCGHPIGVNHEKGLEAHFTHYLERISSGPYINDPKQVIQFDDYTKDLV